MQGVMIAEVSIPANSTVNNIFSGDPFVTLSSPSLISAAMTQSAVGLRVQLSVGGRLAVNDAVPPVSTVMPKIPDDFFFNFGGLTAETIVGRVTNTTAGALTIRAVVQMADG